MNFETGPRKIRDPRVEASAYRIWGWARDREWRTNVVEIAEALDLTVASVRRICALRGWLHRLSSVSRAEYFPMRRSDLQLEGLTGSTVGAMVREITGSEVW